MAIGLSKGAIRLSLLSNLIFQTLAEPFQFTPIAWWAGKGPAVAYQEAAGKIVYSPCNLNGTVQLPRATPYILETPETPRPGSQLAAVGWIDGDNHLWASFFYQTNDSDIRNNAYVCDLSNGRYQRISSESVGSAIARLSSGSVDIHQQTGLAVTGGGEEDGVRLLYHARNMSILTLHYNSTSLPNSAVSLRLLGGSPTGFALSAGYLASRGQFFVAAPANDRAIQISRFSSFDNTNNWSQFAADKSSTGEHKPCERGLENISTWVSSSGHLQVATDSDGNIDIFFIGSDNALHGFVVDLDNQVRNQDISDTNTWPTADQPSSPFGVVSGPNGETWLFYQAGGELAQVHLRNQQWQIASPVPTAALPSQQPPPPITSTTLSSIPTETSAPTTDSPPSSAASAAVTSSRSAVATPAAPAPPPDEHQQATAAGIAVGVVFFALAVAIILTTFLLMRRSRRQAAAQAREQREFDEWRPCRRPSLQHIRPWSWTDSMPPARDGSPETDVETGEPSRAGEDSREADSPARPWVGRAGRPVSDPFNPERIGLAL